MNGAVRDVTIDLRAGEQPSVHVDGAPVPADVMFVPGGVNLRIGAVVYDVQTGGSSDAMSVAAGDHRAIVSLQRHRGITRKSASVRGGEIEVRAPMPGRVIEVLVSVADEVVADQPLIVIEAMKMQNELRAASAGTVTVVEVAPGRNVERGALLLRVRSGG